MALKPETIARLQGILDGTIKVSPAPPADLSTLSAESQARIRAQLGGLFEEAAPNTATQSPVPLMGFNEDNDMQTNEPSIGSLRHADGLIDILEKHGHGDYQEFRNQIALDIYDDGHFNGNWDVSFDPSDYSDTDLPGFRVIQEDEYDQHMDDDEDKPTWEDMVADVPNGYLWMN